ncbi:MAG: hypothetical protein Q7S92_04245 [Candidatus Diapherotrites archaeon]|nr:hypothetical protein [Candidatus Diapherotrites archaeon]
MATTSVALKTETRELLEILKKETQSQTLDETIQKMIRQIKKPKKSMFGAIKGLPKFKREELDRFD